MTQADHFPSSRIYACDLEPFAARYRVDNSRVTLRELCDLSGKPILGTLFWLGIKCGRVKMKPLVIDGPRPFTEEQCTIEDLNDSVRAKLLEVQETATHCGFHSPRYSVANSSAGEVQAGAARMLHTSKRMFLQILVSVCGPSSDCYQLLVSAASNKELVIVSSNGRPNYAPPTGMHTLRAIGALLPELVHLHEGMLNRYSDPLVVFDSFENVGILMDYLATKFFEDKVRRGIYIAEPD